MSANRRDVELSVSVTTANSQAIRDLKSDVDALAKTGGTAAPEFEQLSNALGDMVKQADAMGVIATIGENLAELANSQAQAAEKAKALTAEFESLDSTTQTFAKSQTEAKAALVAAQQELGASRDNLARYKANADTATRGTDDYKAKVREMTNAVIDGRESVRALSLEYNQAREKTSLAASAQDEFGAKVKVADRELGSISNKIRDQTKALDDAKVALVQTGVATDDLIAAQEALKQAQDKSRESIEAIIKAREDAIAAAKRAAQEEERLAIIQMSTRKQLEAQARAEADGIARDYAKMEQAQRQAAASAKAAGQAIADAFGTIGIRSAKEIQQEIERVRLALQQVQSSGALAGRELEQAFTVGNARIKELERDLRAATGQITLMDRATSVFKSTAGQLAAGFGLAEMAQRLGSGFLTANKELESLRLGLNSIYGNGQTAAAQLDFLRKTADQAGVSVGALSQEFVKYSASTQAANIPLEQSNALFEALTQSSATLGLSGDKVSHMLDALSQMAGKGQVSLEELRQQLGDSLPGAMALTAKGLGITDAELIKLVESGGLLARDLFPALTKSLQDMSGEVDTMQSKWERFKNALTLTAQSAGDSGWVNALVGALTALSIPLGAIVIGFTTLSEVLFGTIKAVGIFIAAITSGDFKNIGSAIGGVVDEAVTRQAALIDSYKRLIGLSGDAATAQAAVGKSTSDAAAAQGSAASGTGAYATALAATSETATKAADAVSTLGGVTADSATQAALAGQGWQRLSIEYSKIKDEGDKAILVAEKLVKAKQIEGESTAAMAQLISGERDALIAASSAAQGNVDAMTNLANARTTELAKMIAARDAMVEEAARLNDGDAARQKQIQTINELIVAKAADTERTNQDLASLQNEALTRRSAVAAYEDHAKAVDQLRAAREAAAAILSTYQTLEAEGLATKAQVATATRNLAEAEALYRDAVNDTTDAINRNMSAIQAKASVESAALGLEKARAQSSAELYRSMGNEAAATQALITQKEIDIKLTQVKVRVMNAEADAEITKANNDRAEAQRRGDLNANLQAEIDKRIALAQAKKLEASATAEGVKHLELEIQALRNGTNSRSSNTNSLNADSAARDRNTHSIEKQTDALNKQKKTSDGLETNADGSAKGTFTNTRPIDKAFAAMEAMQKGDTSGFSKEDAQLAVKQAQQSKDWMEAALRLNAGAFSLQAITDTNAMLAASQNVLEQVNARDSGGGKTGATAGAAPGQSGIYTVNVNLGGNKTTVNTASQADANALTAMLRQLESASGRAT